MIEISRILIFLSLDGLGIILSLTSNCCFFHALLRCGWLLMILIIIMMILVWFTNEGGVTLSINQIYVISTVFAIVWSPNNVATSN